MSNGMVSSNHPQKKSSIYPKLLCQSGICRSDLHEFSHRPLSNYANSLLTNFLRHSHRPVAMGHDLCGRVRIPLSTSSFKDGDPVIVDSRFTCNCCAPCLTRTRSYIDCAGVPAWLKSGMEAIREHGLYVMVAVWEQPVSSGERDFSNEV